MTYLETVLELKRQFEGLQADNARLRGLIAEARHVVSKYMNGTCFWCHAEYHQPDNEHEVDCPAFTPEGEVR